MNGQQFLAAYSKITRGHIFQKSGDIGLFMFPSFSRIQGLVHGFTARTGGKSKGDYASLNLSFTRPDELHETVLENHRLFAKAAHIPWESMVMDHFEHGVMVREVDVSHHGMGYLRDPLPFCDGLITNSIGTTLITGHADCVPLYLVDPIRRCIGLAHAGWKGTLGKIGLLAARAMMERYGSCVGDLLIGIGPCICRDCFEVHKDLAEQFMQAYPNIPLISPAKANRPKDRAQLDLVMASVAQFMEAGIAPEQIYAMDVCTFENPAQLYSHRRDKGKTGGMIAYMRLSPEQEGDAFLHMPQERQFV